MGTQPGLAETGQLGRQVQARIAARCREVGATLIGPNGMGLVSTTAGVPTFGAELASIRRGEVALIAQSGSAAISLLHAGRGLGFSVAVSSGNEAVVTVEDLVGVLVEDDETKVVALYVEAFSDRRALASVMERAHALDKPVVALTVGSSSAAKAAVATHTGRLAGDARIVAAALRDLGVLTVSDFDELVETLYLVTRSRNRHAGPRLGVIGLSGGELSMLADTASGEDLPLPELSEATRTRIAEGFGVPTTDRVANPLDAFGFADVPGGGNLELLYAAATQALVADPAIDRVIVVQDAQHHLHDDLVDWYLGAARGVVESGAVASKPVTYLSPLAADPHPRLRAWLEDNDVPVLRGLRPGLRAIAEHARYAMHRQAPPRLARQVELIDSAAVEAWLSEVARQPRAPDERDAKRLLAGCGIPVVEDRFCEKPEQAAVAADAFGYPVVLKVVADGVSHKSEVDGVRLGLTSRDEVSRAFEEVAQAVEQARPGARFRGALVAPQFSAEQELVVGGLRDSTFGPVVMVGLGGIFVEILEDVAFGLAPVTHDGALALLSQLRAGDVLDGWRGRAPVDRSAVADVVVRMGELLACAPAIASIEINPLGARGTSLMALDARVALAPSSVPQHPNEPE